MRSLKESLLKQSRLSESLFDTDLVTKELKFGDFYEFTRFNFEDNNVSYYSQSSYNSFNRIKLAQLKKKYPPADISKAQYGPSWSNIKYRDIDKYVEPIKYIVSLINNIGITHLSVDDSGFIDELRKLVKKEVELYSKDKKLMVSIYHQWGGNILVSINDERNLRWNEYNLTMNLLFERK